MLDKLFSWSILNNSIQFFKVVIEGAFSLIRAFINFLKSSLLSISFTLEILVNPFNSLGRLKFESEGFIPIFLHLQTTISQSQDKLK